MFRSTAMEVVKALKRTTATPSIKRRQRCRHIQSSASIRQEPPLCSELQLASPSQASSPQDTHGNESAGEAVERRVLLACVLSAIAGAGLSAAESLTSAERKTRDLRERIRFQPKSKERGCAELDWGSLAQINSEIVGWITVSGTSIDLPVALPSKNKARDWYLDHDAWGKRSELGCPYLDVRCEERGAHLLVFGHRLGRSHHMFTELAGTHEQSTFDAIGNATWNSRAESEVFEPVLSLVVDKDDALIQRFEFDSPSELRDWLTDLLARSAAHTGNASDIALEARRALTLVTCAEARRGGRRRTLVVFATR